LSNADLQVSAADASGDKTAIPAKKTLYTQDIYRYDFS
jgi:hypothetical protein